MNWNEELRIFKKPQKIFSYSFISVVLLATLFLLIQVLSPKEQAVGDVDGNNTDSVWAGTLGPAAVNTANSDVELVSNVSITQNTTTLEYQAGLSSGQTSGFIRSKTIDVVPSGSLKTWKKIQLGITRPVGTTTTFTVDILCASSAEGCIVNQPLLSNVPLTNDEYQLPASLNSKTKIKVQVNFSRPDTTNPITVMYNWQVHWEINSGVSLVVSKSSGNPTPNTVNPELVNGSWPGVNNNNQVVYTASYSLNRSVQNLKIEIPFPTGSYTPSSGPTKTYNSTYVGSGGSDTCQNSGGGNVSCTSSSAVKATFSLGNLSAVAGSVSVTFKIKSGPPNGVVFKTKPKIYGDDYPAQTLPDDVLNVESRAFATGILISPEYIAASRDFHFIARLALGGTVFQSDMFNARYVLDYSASTCVSNTVTPVLYGSGATSTTIDTANRRVTFYLSSPVTLPTPSLVYGIKLRANSSCNTPSAIPATLTFYSEQDASFIATKTTNAQIWGGTWPKFDSTDIQRMQMTLNGPPALVGAGQLITYNLRINQQTSFPTSDFWAMFRVPNNVTLVSANLTLATLASLGAIPNNWKIYYSTSSLANRTLGNWVELTNGTPTSGGSPPCQGPYGCVPNPPPGQKINWIKWELGGNAFQWDRHANFDEVMAQVSVVTDNNASGTITAQGYLFSGVTCLNPCPVVNTINVNNQPYFNVNQLPCTTESSTDSYTGCPTFPGDNITVASGNPYFIRATVGNSHESGPSSRGDAFNVRVRVRGPDMQYLDQSNPFDSADGPHARCSTQSKANDTNCPNASGVNQNPAPWLDPSLINCSSATGSQCFFEWVIPVIYSINKFPQTFPYDYSFHVKFNVREGVINQTKICDGGVGPCNVDIVSSSPSPQNTNLPKPSSYSVTVASSPKLTVQKELAPGYSSPINYGTATRFRINYRNLPPSTGAVNSVTIIERLPINTEVQPQARLNLDLGFLPNDPAASSVGGVSAYYKLQDPAFPRTSDTPPPKNDPGWISFSSFNSSQIPLIDWVKWERNFLFPVDSGTDDGQDYFDIGLVDTGSPDDIVFTNKAFLLWSTGTEELSVEATAQVRIDTPGFVTTSQGDVASVGKLGSSVDRSGACSSPTNCHTNYLGIAGESFANDFFTSFKDWLVEDYDFAQENGGLKTNYAKMEKDYGKNAVSCSDENSCLNGPEKVVKYTVSGGNPLKINTLGSYTNSTYQPQSTPVALPGTPKMVFVDGGGSTDALEINTNIKTGATTGLIFVVNGNVKVAYGVTDLDGVFLVEGKFSTGRRTQLVSNGQAGQFATISVGRDGFARIAYVSGDNVRFIKCLDINCTNKDYGYVTTVVGSDVVAVSMGLYDTPFGATIDYPKIVVGMRNATGATTKFISCYDKDTSTNGHKEGETCLDNDTVVYPDANDPDIIVAPDGIPSYIYGTGTNGNRAVAIANCRINWPAPDDPNCPSPAITNLDGGNGTNKGNESSYSNDPTTGVFGSLVATYVDRSAGKSDLWFAKLRYDNLGTGCSQVNNWDCKPLVGTSGVPGNVGPYHASATHPTNGITRAAYVDTSNGDLKYLQCVAKTCTSIFNTSVDCISNCQANSYVSLATQGVLSAILYNTTATSGNDEVKYSYCGSPSLCGYSSIYWGIQSISNNPGKYVTSKAKVYTQSMALGRTVEANIPRFVFFDNQAGNNFLIYVRCIDLQCTPSNLTYSFIDDGTAVSLPDKQLNFKGSIIAFGAGLSGTEQAINLQRDLFGESTFKPGEIFTLEPKYFYVFRDVIKEPQRTFELPP